MRRRPANLFVFVIVACSLAVVVRALCLMDERPKKDVNRDGNPKRNKTNIEYQTMKNKQKANRKQLTIKTNKNKNKLKQVNNKQHEQHTNHNKTHHPTCDRISPKTGSEKIGVKEIRRIF